MKKDWKKRLTIAVIDLILAILIVLSVLKIVPFWVPVLYVILYAVIYFIQKTVTDLTQIKEDESK